MDVREKLVELLHKGVRCPGVIDNCNDCPYYSFEKACDEFGATVDLLIANGVTVQEWISVKDRLPEQGEEAICIAADGDMMIGKYTEWGWMFPCYFEDLTHWMPLPQPPKGE